MSEFNELFDDHLFNIDDAKEKTVKLREGERRMVSILFADVKGFTALSEQLDHEDIQTLMDHIMKIFTHSVEIHGGYVDKYTGDQIMALFGAKVASEVDTERAISTGLDMLNKLHKFNLIASKSAKYKIDITFNIRVGIHTGMVTTGKIGKEREGDYTVYGDAVNLASRMESNAPVDSIMIPEYTMNLVRDSFEFKDNGQIKVKGKKEPVSVFTVKSKKDHQVSHSSPFVGRENELEELSRLYIDCNKYLKVGLTEKLSVIGLHADAGVGKSRLIYEFLNNQVNMNMDLFSLGACSNISSQPYHLFTTLIKDSFSISIIDNDKESRRKFEEGISYLKSINESKAAYIEKAKVFLGFLIGIKYNDPRLSDKKELVNHFRISIRVFLEALSSKANHMNKVFIIIFEDLHWIDQMSQETLEFLLQTFNLQDKRDKSKLAVPLFICTYRNEYKIDSSITSACKFFDIKLENLEENASFDLIEKLTKNIDLDKNKILELYKKSNGNPFFIEEWVRLLRNTHSSETIDVSREITTEYIIPNTLNSLILSRIDSLEKDLKLLLQKATIIGEDFFIKILSLLERKLGGEENIIEPIHDLESENFIHHYLKELDHYRFKHILTRDVAYSTMLKSNKKILHKAVGDVIEENFTDIIEKFYYDLAVHYDSCENYKKAVKYLKKAGYKYNNLLDKNSALKCFSRSVDIIKTHKLDDLDSLYECQINCADIYCYIGNTEESLKIIQSLLKKNLSRKRKARLSYINGFSLSSIRESTKALEQFKLSSNLYSDLKDSDMVADIDTRIGLSYIDIGKYDDSMDCFNKAIDHYKKENNVLEAASCYGCMGNIYLFQGKLDKAREIFEKQYEISKKMDSKTNILLSLGNMALIDNIHGRYTSSINKFNEILIISEDINDTMNICKTYGNIGIAYKNLEEYDEAFNNFNKQLKISKKSNYKGQQTFSLINIGIVFHKKGEFEESIKHFNSAEKIIKHTNDINAQSLIYANRASLFIDKGKFDDAFKEFNNANKIFKNLDNLRALSLTDFNISKIYVLKEDYKTAYSIISKTYKYFKKINDLPYYCESLIIKSEIERNIDNFKEAENSIDEAIKVAEKLNSDRLSNTAVIEKYIIYLQKDKCSDSATKLKLLTDRKISEEHKGHIHYNLWKYASSNESKKSSLKIYKQLYKKIPKHQYKVIIDELS